MIPLALKPAPGGSQKAVVTDRSGLVYPVAQRSLSQLPRILSFITRRFVTMPGMGALSSVVRSRLHNSGERSSDEKIWSFIRINSGRTPPEPCLAGRENHHAERM